MVKSCNVCQMNQRLPKKSIPHPWIRPKEKWERIHIDYAGPFKGSMWLIIVDSFSKWIEVENMKNSTTALNTIKKLTIVFSRYGNPKILVSDNARQLVTSHDFEMFCKRNGITHIPIPSYHPASNGQAESIVGKFKSAMKKMCVKNSDMEIEIAQWLLNYHNTPHSTTGVEPAVLMTGRRLRSTLSLLNPLSVSTTKHRAKETVERIDSEKSLRRFKNGDDVLYRDVIHGKWIRGTVIECSDKQYTIETVDGVIIRKHIDHVIASTSQPRDTEPTDIVTPVSEQMNVPTEQPQPINDINPPLPVTQSTPDTDNIPQNLLGSCSRRTIKKPERLGYSGS